MNLPRLLSPLLLLAILGAPRLHAESVWDAAREPLDHPATITVYKSPTCGCCGAWIDHLERHGFTVKRIDRNDMGDVKRQLGVPERLASCHTASVEGYVIEGHVPADDIKRLLRERPAVKGLSAPGMPVGSPGMEMGGEREPFSVISWSGDDGGAPELHLYRNH